MKKYWPLVIVALGLVIMLLPSGGSVSAPDDAERAHQAMVAYAQAQATSYRMAADLPEKEADKFMLDRLPQDRQSTLGEEIDSILARGAYVDGKFDQDAFARTMRAIADGMDEVK